MEEKLILNRRQSFVNPDLSIGFKDVLSFTEPNLPQSVLDQICIHQNQTQVFEEEDAKVSSSSWGKVCLICLCTPRSGDDFSDGDVSDDVLSDEDFDDVNCCVYIVDLDRDHGDEWSCKDPAVCFNFVRFGIGCFCVLGTTLFMFEGLWSEGKKRVFTYEMSSEASNLKLDRSDLVETTPMNHPKSAGAQAIPTPNGKILVFSIMVHVDYPFELYDPSDRVWQQLPPLPRRACYDKDHRIYGYTFLHNEPVWLIHSDNGLFTLDLRSSDFSWERFHPFGAPCHPYLRHIRSSFLVLGDNLCIGGWGSYEFKETESFPYPKPDLCAHQEVTLLKMIENRECEFCGVSSWVDKETMIPHLIINVYNIDYLKYEVDKMKEMKKQVSPLPGATVCKSFKFGAAPLVDDDFSITYFSSMSTT